MTQRKRAPTISDIARLAGVSPTTVSFVLNEVSGSGISEETQSRVKSFAHELGYRPNATAKLLRTNRSHTIGFVTDEIASTPFAGNVIKGAQDAAWDNEKILMIVNTDRNQEIKESAVEMILERRVEGIIYAAMYHQAVEPPTRSHEVPLVLLDCFSEDLAFTSVVPDEVSGGHTATEVLLAKGHRKIGFINLTPGLPAAVGRLEGYKQALAEYGVGFDASLVKYSDGTANGGYLCALEMLRREELPTAIFCGTDHVAMGTYEALKERGLNIPEDVAIVGFDNQELIAPHLRPPLSTVALPHYEMGQRAVEHLIRQAAHAQSTPVQHTIACPYVERESV
ncbi:MAG: LacI family DNA-binding transcriptional regulator [Rubrobacteraceae bacterium]